MQEILLVVDMQRDFVDGALGTADAQAIVAAAADRVAAARDRGERVLFTRDTHSTDYLTTQEGRNLPVVHCLAQTPGWQILPELLDRAEEAEIFDKPGFGSVALGEYLREADRTEPIGKITPTPCCSRPFCRRRRFGWRQPAALGSRRRATSGPWRPWPPVRSTFWNKRGQPKGAGNLPAPLFFLMKMPRVKMPRARRYSPDGQSSACPGTVISRSRSR